MTLTLSQAQGVIGRAIEAAEAQGVPIAAAVLDTGGHPVATARMDGVGYFNLDVARRKAVAVVTFKMPTHELVQAVSRDPMVQQILYAEQGLSILPGGLPIRDGDTVVGALGIAGGMYFQDQAIAEYALGAG